MKENLPKAKVEKMLIAKKKWKIFRKNVTLNKMVNGDNKKGKAVTAFPFVVLEIDCFT